ncbi:hypothetical protein N7481_009789 [Penicillium waksmanii]|uniref:uncharacterized protein n=1 Tax=Penicillium waksmanii TaxID=69791 RepID=UPI00254946F7|nr:uncharacterized protein N7481_009789 [Penicillium waksmanii]KAJ5976082.1 hypothetical protein N7481_009789 [Penicillium waksmanii]
MGLTQTVLGREVLQSPMSGALIYFLCPKDVDSGTPKYTLPTTLDNIGRSWLSQTRISTD